MDKKINILQLNETEYQDGLLLQETIFNAQLERLSKNKPTTNTLILLQHSPVYTLGKSGNINNLKVPIEETGADYYQTNRGGDITFHGPGQIVGYPIFNISELGLNTKEYVYELEQCIIDCMRSFGLKCNRIEGASGVWVASKGPIPRKLCAIGLKLSRGISMHGFALNVDPNLSYFENIVPCGLEDKAVTSMRKELGKAVKLWEVQERLLLYLKKHFE